MIIQFGYRDEPFLKLARALETRYPDDLVQAGTFSLLNDAGDSLTEKDGHPIERITFFSHGGFNRYGKLSVDEFVTQLIDSLRAADARKPGSSAQIKTIDLIGCHIGFIAPGHESVSMTIAKRLHDAGYPMQVNAFTNMTHSKPHKMHNVIVLANRGTYTVFVLPTKKAFKAYSDDKAQAAVHKEEKDKQAILLAENRAELKHCRKDLKKAGTDEEKEALQIRIEALEVDIHDNTLAVEQHKERIDYFRARAFSHGISLAQTQDPRAYLDTEPQCNFTMRVTDGLGIEKGAHHPVFEAAQKGDAEALRRALEENSVLIDMPGSSGATPLFSAAFYGHLACVKILLEAGAKHHLAPAVDITNLFRQLTPSQHAAAHAFIRAKYSEPLYSTTVQISPVEIALIRGQRSIEFLIDCHITDQSPLHRAVALDDFDTLSDLAPYYVDQLNEKDIRGFTPLLLAAFNGYVACADLLLRRGANPHVPLECSARWLRKQLPRFSAPLVGEHLEVEPASLAKLRGHERVSHLITGTATTTGMSRSVSVVPVDPTGDLVMRMKEELRDMKADSSALPRIFKR